MDNTTKHLAGHILKGLTESDKPDSPAQNRAQAAILGMLFFFLAEVVRISLRINFGRKGIDMTKVWVSALLFAATGIYIYITKDSTFYEIQALMLLVGAIAILLQARYQIKHAKDDSDYRGHIDGEMPGSNAVLYRYILEPITAILTGIMVGYIVYFIDGVFGWALALPVIICGVSIWGEAVANHLFGKTQGQQMAEKVNLVNNRLDPTNNMNEVVID